MKAVVCTRYGPPEVLHLQEVENPPVRDDEVLIRVRATTVTRGDAILRNLPGFPSLPLRLAMRIVVGWRRPRRKVLGVEFAGEVESVGDRVTRFKRGDSVYGTTGFRFGCYAEYVSLPEGKTVALKPSNMGFEEAASVPIGAETAWHYLHRKGNLRNGQTALIYGASGSVGSFAVQLAKVLGAEVTAVTSTSNLDLVKSLGADDVLDYTKGDFANRDKRYDLIFDAVGKTSPSRSKRALKRGGTFVSSAKGLARDRPQDLAYFKELIEAGKLRSLIDRRYPLGRIAEAHAYVDQWRKKGNVVITVADGMALEGGMPSLADVY